MNKEKLERLITIAAALVVMVLGSYLLTVGFFALMEGILEE